MLDRGNICGLPFEVEGPDGDEEELDDDDALGENSSCGSNGTWTTRKRSALSADGTKNP